MIHALVYLLVVVIIIALINWAVTTLAVPDPIRRVVLVASVVLGVLAIVVVLLNVLGISTGIDMPKMQ